MTILLDTHAVIWALSSPSKLPAKVRTLLADTEIPVFVSVISSWEIAIKKQLKKIDFPLDKMSVALQAASFIELPLVIKHTLAFEQLPFHHRDPFDRMLIAQALSEKLTIVSRDPLLQRYEVDVLWA